MEPRLILASGSQSRRQMLVSAGVAFDVVPSNVDEAALKHEMEVELIYGPGFPVTEAVTLAGEKACEVSRRYPAALVIGADQTLWISARQRTLDKPTSIDEARQHLELMRGHSHTLHSAVALAQGGEIVWRHVVAAHLTMRNVSDAFLDDYLARTGDAVLSSVGCYQLEGLGIQLFERIEGDYFTILGMPLLPLLEELRRRKVIPT